MEEISDVVSEMQCANEIACEAVSAFSDMHPDIKMTLRQWEDLKECIERETRGRGFGDQVWARQLLKENNQAR